MLMHIKESVRTSTSLSLCLHYTQGKYWATKLKVADAEASKHSTRKMCKVQRGEHEGMWMRARAVVGAGDRPPEYLAHTAKSSSPARLSQLHPKDKWVERRTACQNRSHLFRCAAEGAPCPPISWYTHLMWERRSRAGDPSPSGEPSPWSSVRRWLCHHSRLPSPNHPRIGCCSGPTWQSPWVAPDGS